MWLPAAVCFDELEPILDEHNKATKGGIPAILWKIKAGCFREDRIKKSLAAVSKWQFTILKMKVVRPYSLTDENLLWTRLDMNGNYIEDFC